MSDFKGNDSLTGFDKDSFAQDIQRLGTIRKFTCFFDSANFLMTPYNPLTNSIHAIFEFESGDTLQFETLLCGYAGHGPSVTIAALTYLGIPPEKTNWYCAHRGIQLTLELVGGGRYQVTNESFLCWLDPSDRIGYSIDRADYSISIVRRTVVVTNPEDQLDELWRVIRLCDPLSMDYSTDAKNPLYSERELIDGGLLFNGYRSAFMSMDANVLLCGGNFDVYICFRKDALLSMLNALCFSLTGHVLLRVHRFWKFLFLVDRPI